jgi:F0F1-type ATP synthase delta subunit
MKYPARIYAQALAEAMAMAHGKTADEIRKNFMELLRRSGDEAHLAKILEEAERFLREKDGTKKFSVQVARLQKIPARELIKHLIGPNDRVEEETDPSLISGMKVVVNDEMVFDGSLRAKLDKLFFVSSKL